MSFTGVDSLITTVARLRVRLRARLRAPAGLAGAALPLPARDPAGLRRRTTGPRSNPTVTWSAR